MTDRPDETETALNENAHALKGLVRRLVLDGDAAEDVGQQVWLAALRSQERPRGFRAWAAGVVRNITRQDHRAGQRRRRREEVAARPEVDPRTPDSVASQKESLRSLTRAVLALEPPYDEVVLLRFYRGWSTADIARHLGVPVETTRSRLKRAVAKLRERLDEDHGGDRARWCLPVVALLGLGPEILAATGAAATGAVAGKSGVAIMSAKAKVGVAAAVAAIVVVLAWSGSAWFGGDDTEIETAGAKAGIDRGSQVRREAGDVTAQKPRTEEEETAGGVHEEPEEVAPRIGSLVVRVSWWDGTPADRVFVEVTPWGTSNPHSRGWWTTPGADGVVRFESVPAGRVSVDVVPGPSKMVTLEPGEEEVVEFKLAQGFDLHGTVVDDEGDPIPDAEVWIGSQAFSTGTVVTKTSATGKFELRSVMGDMAVAVRKRGYERSLRRQFGASKYGEVVETRFVLKRTKRGVRGIVTDIAGEGIAGARVLVGWERSMSRELPDGSWGATAPSVLLTTDEEGTFELVGLEAGRLHVKVRKRGLAPWANVYDHTAESMKELSIVLREGVTLEGTVKGKDGKPVPGAQVSYGEYGAFDSCRVQADAEGRYSLDELPAGDIHVQAAKHQLGKARKAIQGAPGTTVTWNPVLSAGAELVGRVLDERDAPLVGWRLDLTDGGNLGGWRGHAETDAEGRFKVINCDTHEPLEIEVSRPGREKLPVLTVKNVELTDEELIIRVMDDVQPSATVRARVRGRDGRTPEMAQLVVWAEGRNSAPGYQMDRDTGIITVGPITPGRYRFTLMSKGELPVFVGTFDLGVGETRDLGTLEFVEPGSVVVTWRREASREGIRYPYLEAGGHWYTKLEKTVDGWKADAAPGEYVVVLKDWSGGDHESAFEGRYPLRVTSGGVVTVDVKE